MNFVPSSSAYLATSYKLTKLVAQSATAQEVLEAADEAEALAKITTYSEEDFGFPRCIILENQVQFETDEGGQNVIDVKRYLGCEFFFYTPAPADFRLLDGWEGEADGEITLQDEHSYVLEKFSFILTEMMAKSSTPGYLATHDPVVYQPERYPMSERPDVDELEKGDEARSLWFGIIGFNVR